MPKTKPTELAEPMPLADPTSDRVVLYRTGTGRPVGTPHRDLTAADLARMAYREAASVGLSEGRRPDPRTPDQDIASRIAEWLCASGAYTTTPVAGTAPDTTTPAGDSATTTEG